MSPRLAIAPFVSVLGAMMIFQGSTARAAILFDPFTDGQLVGGTDNSGIDWFRRSANHAIVIETDAGIGTGNALRLNATNGVQANRAILGTFSAFTLANVGDSISLSFDFRFNVVPAANTADGFRFGLYSSNNTVVISDGTTLSDDDRGYQASIGTNATAGFNIFKETNSGAGGVGSSDPISDRSTLDPTVANTFLVSDTLKHSAFFSITRTASGVSITASVDGTLLGTATNTTSPFFTFDEVVINSGSPQTYFVDNVQVETAIVPEPASALLAAGGIFGLLTCRRRRVQGC